MPYLSQFNMPFCLAQQSIQHLQFHSHSRMHFILTQSHVFYYQSFHLNDEIIIELIVKKTHITLTLSNF